MAVKTSTDARNAKLDIQIQEAQNKQTIALAYPHINAKAGLNYFYLPTMSFADASTFDFTGSLHLPKGQYVASFQFMLPYGADASITTSQVLFDGALTIAVKARNAVLDLAKHKSEMTEEAVRYNVSKTYYSVAIAQKQFKIVSASLATMRSMEREQKQYYATGFVEKLDWERIAVMANNLATDSIKFALVLRLLLKLYSLILLLKIKDKKHLIW
jgi:outer membrane protein TolC